MAMGTFLLAMIPARHWMAANLVRLRLPHLAAAGAVIGFLTGSVAATGSADVPFFLGYGLTGGAFIGTEAAASLAVYATKSVTVGGSGALPVEVVTRALVVGASLMVGAFVAKPFVLRLAPETFRYVVDGLPLISGLSLLWRAS
ncbi:hypothetical protein [Methylobacterium sp. J-068]|uniref:hypothetical protein n=1 Tax=Methylobacterium sp. J-068 TaxID=2836649 RepID=UPI001FB95027|nr:hypothetical protein [Methylobacterium sp. J-068]MCJ2033832.1 hypothetical protein [Methylobacterium sp. J-068]